MLQGLIQLFVPQPAGPDKDFTNPQLLFIERLFQSFLGEVALTNPHIPKRWFEPLGSKEFLQHETGEKVKGQSHNKKDEGKRNEIRLKATKTSPKLDY